MSPINNATKMIESEIDIQLSNPYIMAVLKVGLVLFAAQIAPRTPPYIQDFFKNTYVKLILISLIVYISEKDLQLALLVSIIFVLGSNLLSGRAYLESFQSFSEGKEFADYSSEYKSNGKMKLLESTSDLFPGCESVTMAELQTLFNGDVSKFSKAVNHSFLQLISRAKDKPSKDRIMAIGRYAGLSENMTFENPDTAPYLATLLVNYGFNINDKCQPPTKFY
jgi:hypothetical protein